MLSLLEEKLEELKQLNKSGLIDKDEYRDLKEKAYVAYSKVPPSLQNINTAQNTQRRQATVYTQPQRTYSAPRTQSTRNAQHTQPHHTHNTQAQQKKTKNRFSPFAIFIIISILVGLLRDCN